MSKKGNNGGTPIEFRVSTGLRGQRIPVPVNQSSWKYGNSSIQSKPKVYEWVLVTGMSAILIALAIAVLIRGNVNTPEAWALVMFLGGTPILLLAVTISRAFYYKKMAGNNKSSEKRKKKKPKHRKDYK